MQVKYWVLAAAGMLWAGGWSMAEAPGKPAFEPYVGEVTIRTLNVRSGPSTNYYVVTRLNQGARVHVVGEESGWLAITPPRGCFSLIAAEYVDRGEGDTGVVNADNIRVRTGSQLSSDNYAVQLKLQRGALVRVLGQADAQFLKIEPPAGVTVWASREYVHRVPGAVPGPETEFAGAEPALDHPLESEAAPVTEEPASSPDPKASLRAPGLEVAESKLKKVEAPAPEIAALSADESRGQLEALDAEMKEEMAKPLMRRDFTGLLPRYCALAEQTADEYTRAYAGIRLRQIEAAQEMAEGLRQVQQLHEDVRTVRKDALAGRTNVRPMPVRIDGGFDAEGELRPSALYDSPVGPRRYRLVDPASAPPRTLAYVEISPGTDFDMADYLGRRVGVRARERVLPSGNVNPVPIYVAAELVVLDRPGDEAEGVLARQPAQAKPPSSSSEEPPTVARP
ncbi:MAG: SH3 domain-containing protein [Planctomycetota bacterium]